MLRETEPSANGALGGLVQGMMSGCRVRSENARAIVGRPGLQSDVLVTAARILRTLKGTAQRVDAAGVTNAHDLTGRIFQRLIADRKYLATFYTLPSAAALLARLAVAKMEVDWSDAQAIGNSYRVFRARNGGAAGGGV